MAHPRRPQLLGILALALLGAGCAGPRAAQPVPCVATPAPPPTAPAEGDDPELWAASLRRIESNLQAVASDPRNRAAWVQLGNDYFDTHQRERSIEAYSHALALRGDDADVLTDKGVMHYQLGDYENAAAAFLRAREVNPRHPQSWFNYGILCQVGLHRPEEAAAAYRRVIELVPGTHMARLSAQALAEMAR